MKDITIFPVGTKVKFGEDKNIKGEISGITIREDTIKYEITFWRDIELKTIWLSVNQFTTDKRNKEVKLGFAI